MLHGGGENLQQLAEKVANISIESLGGITEDDLLNGKVIVQLSYKQTKSWGRTGGMRSGSIPDIMPTNSHYVIMGYTTTSNGSGTNIIDLNTFAEVGELPDGVKGVYIKEMFGDNYNSEKGTIKFKYGVLKVTSLSDSASRLAVYNDESSIDRITQHILFPINSIGSIGQYSSSVIPLYDGSLIIAEGYGYSAMGASGGYRNLYKYEPTIEIIKKEE